MRLKRRPTICRPTWAILLFAVWIIILFGRGDRWWAVAMAGATAAFFLLTWLTAPHSKFAATLIDPSADDVRRSRERAVRIKQWPVIGPALRFGDKLSRHSGDQLSRAYQQELRNRAGRQEHEWDDPRRTRRGNA